MVAGFFVILMMLVGIGLFVMMCIARWKLFVKFGEPGWKSLIPFYSTYIQYGYVWRAKIGTIMVICSVASLLLPLLLPVTYTIGVIGTYRTARVFAQDDYFAFGLIFLPFIFLPILAFGDARYHGRWR